MEVNPVRCSLLSDHYPSTFLLPVLFSCHRRWVVLPTLPEMPQLSEISRRREATVAASSDLLDFLSKNILIMKELAVLRLPERVS